MIRVIIRNANRIFWMKEVYKIHITISRYYGTWLLCMAPWGNNIKGVMQIFGYSLWRRSTDSDDGETLHNGFQKEISVEVRVVIRNAEFEVGGCVEGIAFVQIEMEVSPWSCFRRGL